MKRYGYLQTIFMSFYSRDLYRDVAKNWGAGVVLYLFILLAFSWLMMMIVMQPAINHFYQKFSDEYVQQVPDMVVTEGVIKTPENKPYLIKDKNQKMVGIIDTSGRYLSLEKTSASFLLTKTQVFYRDKDEDNQIKTKTLSSKLNLTVKPKEIDRVGQKLAGWVWVLIFPFCLIFSFIYRLAQSLIYAILGKFFAKMSRVSLCYSDLLKLSMVAVTPAIVINTILDFTGMMFHYEWLFYFIIAMIYLNFAVQANRDK